MEVSVTSLQIRSDLQGVLQRARENAQGAQVKVVELGEILQALPRQDTIDSRVSSMACSLFQTKVTKENSTDIAILAKTLYTIAAAAIPKSTLEKYILKIDALSAPVWFPLVCQELGLGKEAPTK